MATAWIVTMKCKRCGHKWKRRTKYLDGPDPPCPNLDCGEVQTAIGMDLTIPKAPAQVGQNIHVKAIDETARIVMEDQGLTDLRTDVRVGETAEPKISPAARAAADAFFGGGTNGRKGMPILGMPGMTLGDLGGGGFRPNVSVARALSGALNDPVSTRRAISEFEGTPRQVRGTRVIAEHG